MAEDSDLERTEPPTPKRLQDAREKGQVARSRELSTFAGLLGGTAVLLFAGGALALTLLSVFERGLRFDRREAFDPQLGLERLAMLNQEALLGLAPLLVAVPLALVLSSLLVSGWIFTGQPMAPQASRLNPLSGFKRMFSAQGLIELAKAVLKTVFIGAIAAIFLWVYLADWLQLSEGALAGSVAYGLRLTAEGLIWVIAGLVVVVAIDVPFQLWNHQKQLRMTKEEVRRELKEQEGDPQLKARIRAIQRDVARRRMMARVPEADVVITNPQHYAVALRYESGRMTAPRVLAKGMDRVALRISEIAREHRVPILEAPPLARALCASAEVGEEIPAALYTAVAEVLAWVYALQNDPRNAVPPTDLPVPAALDPLQRRAAASYATGGRAASANTGQPGALA